MIRIGLLGASRIAVAAVIDPASDIDDCSITRVAARDALRAAQYADKHGIAGTEADYSALVNSSDVDLVYNALPPSEHCAWSIAALEAGKHVLCEKPFAMNAREAKRMVEAAGRSGRVLIEAFHYRFHPLFSRVLELVHTGAIGSIETLDAHFNVPIRYSETELRYRPGLGGGAMMDLGCYPLHWVRSIMNAEPEVLSARAIRHQSGVDLAMSAELEFPSGVRASISAAMGGDIPDKLDAVLALHGSRGDLIVVNPLAPHMGHSLRIETKDAERAEELDGKSTYFHQLEHVVAVLREEQTAITGGGDAIASMRAMDAIYAASGLR